MSNPADDFQVYFRRWWMLVMFCFMIISNATMWVTFAPISDIAEVYFGPTAGSTTNVNMLAIVFLMFYPLGTLLEVKCMEMYQLRGTILLGGVLTATGALLRLLAAIGPSQDSIWTYVIMLLGQIFGALAQPLFMNCPASLSAAWFPPSERDIATAFGSLSSALGNAVGSVLPVLFVHKGSSQEAINDGMLEIMLVEFILCSLPLLSCYFYFENTPPTAPSYSAFLKHGATGAKSKLDQNTENAIEGAPSALDTDDVAELIELSSNHSVAQWASAMDQVRMLYGNRNYCLLFCAFCLGLGIFTALMTLINQIVEPYGYSNDDAGTFAACLLVSGLLGAGISSKLLETTKAYETVLKSGFLICLLAFSFMISQLQRDNFTMLCLAFGITGFGLLPMLPATIENTAECTYPDVTEDLAVGLLFMGGNVVGILFCFSIEAMLKKEVKEYGEGGNDDFQDYPEINPFLKPSNISMLSTILLAVFLLFFYEGDYRRMEADRLDYRYNNDNNNNQTYSRDNFDKGGTLKDSLLSEQSITSSSKAATSMAFSQRDTINYNVDTRGRLYDKPQSNIDAIKNVLRDSGELRN